MCGLAGFVGASVDLTSLAKSFQQSLHHRGPDDNGQFIDQAAQVALVHTRLAILDLSPAGHQPMQTADERFTIVFNGEIYNYRELREELVTAGVALKSHSDTEVLLHLYARDGCRMLQRLEGMFALAIWDRPEQSLFLARDPLGIKPLYFWYDGRRLAFASEVRALLASQLFPAKLDPDAVYRFLLFGSVQEPDSLIDGVKQLPAGHWAIFKNGNLSTHQYWSLTYSTEIDQPAIARKAVRSAFDESIRRHFVSDVPVGIFLSGGIDSTALVALARSAGYEALQTFCISFDDPAYSEGSVAERTAQHFGTQHHDWKMSASEGRSLLGDFLECTDLPGIDGFNTFCVSLLARRHGLKVVLSGVGGDEFFGGYPSFARVPQLMKWRQKLHVFAEPCGLALNALAELTSSGRAQQLRRLAVFLRSAGGAKAAYWTCRSIFTPQEAAKITREICGPAPGSSTDDSLGDLKEMPAIENVVGFLEASLYMRNQLLRDSDVMSMAHGLELRVPFVDQKLCDVVNTIAPSIRYQTNKQLILDAVPEIPRWVYEKPKQGFRFPFESWAQQDWASQFREVEQSTAVPLNSWYRKWTLFALRHFIQKRL
jgi:asparagine synthase (glutamine-hydrolysing)